MTSDDRGLEAGERGKSADNARSGSAGAPAKKMPFSIVLVFLFLAVSIGIAGFLFYDTQKGYIVKGAENELAAIAMLKVRQIAAWRGNIERDAQRIFSNRLFSRNLQEFFRSPQPAGIKRDLMTWLTILHETEGYREVFLYDGKGSLSLSVPGENSNEALHAAALVQEALRTGNIIITDLHRDDASGEIHISIVVPIHRDSGDSAHAIGVLLLTVDPSRLLFPLVQSWPVPSETAETLLVRREGDKVVFLNGPRYRRNAALSLRLPVSDAGLPAAMAVRGATGVVYGRDYRGVPVVAAVRAVPGSPWFIVAKMDRDEVYAPVSKRAGLVALIVLAAISGSGLIVGIWWRQQQVKHYRKQYEASEALCRSEERYRKALDSMIEGCQIIGYDWRYLYLNDSSAMHGRRKKEELLGRTMMEAYPGIEATELFSALSQCMQKRAPRAMENEFVYPDGSKGWFDLSVQPVQEGIFVLSVDITARKKAEEELKKYMTELKRSNEELQQFAYIASHDLQEPLRMISSYLQLIERRYKGKLDKDADDFIAFAVGGANRLQDMITGLLAYSRVQTKGKPVRDVAAGEVLGHAISNIKIAIEESGALITAGRLPVVSADEGQLVQVFQNLISNAIKFRGSERPVVHVSAERDGPEWVFSVKDNGVGISAQYGDRIFNIFQRLHGREYPGVGIGLSVCRRIVERHGGRIWFKSEPGKGTTFYFTIPEKEVGEA